MHLTNGPLAHSCETATISAKSTIAGKSWPGEHAAIVDAETFAKVQAKLDEQRVARAERLKSNALLIGKLFNEAGEKLTPSYAIKQAFAIGTTSRRRQCRREIGRPPPPTACRRQPLRRPSLTRCARR